MIGIYKFTNKINNKVYIGQSINIKSRYNRHKRGYKNTDNYFYRAIRKYGWDNFEFEIICECPKEELSEKEIFYIKYYNSNNSNYGYNMTAGGEGGRGMKHTKEYKEKMSIRMKENNPMKNKETAEKVSKKLKGHKPPEKTEEGKKRISIRMKENNPMKNKETAEKVSKTKTGVNLSDIQKQKISESLLGRKFSEEHILKLKEAAANRKRDAHGHFIKK